MLKNKEIWRDVKGFEGLYQVSDKGRVKSLERTFIDKIGRKRTILGRILKPGITPSGYLQVHLFDSSRGVEKWFLVHRLVCGAFHQNPENKPCVNHIDENKANNAASNLEWCTAFENNTHGTRTARMAKTQSKPVGQYTTDYKLVKVWQSTREVKSNLGFDRGNISKAALGKYKTAYGYVWKYIEEKIN